MHLYRRSGFTLVELLIVVVVIGILASIAIPRFSRMRDKSLVATVTSDLKNLASSQEIYLSDNHAYAATLTELADYRHSDNVIISINEASGTGWAATATHAGLAGAQCGIFYGSADPLNGPPATTPGSVICD
jgi:prepilin-type N-terminal cleavage/methylation domain-containing protein